MSVRLAVDIGGTFTDATLIDEETGRVSIAKVLSTPADPSEGFMARRRARALPRRGGRGARSASSSTRPPSRRTRSSRARSRAAASSRPTGFRDLLEIARQVRPTLYDTQFEKPPPLVPRDRAVGVVERLGPKGEVLDAARRRLGARGGGAAAPRGASSRSRSACSTPTSTRAHERRVGAILAEELPGRAGLALVRGRARVPRVPARLDDRDQRRDPARRRAATSSGSRGGSPRPGSRRSCS